ncbi:MAG: ABC transporter-like protein [Nitrospirae bacterium]|nr:MAG: ABC transporter-like protein [Nitrospirota bacterium]
MNSQKRFNNETTRFLLQKIGHRNVFLLFATVFVMSLLDLAGIAIIFPSLQVVTQPDAAEKILAVIGVTSTALLELTHRQLSVALGVGLALFYMVKTFFQTALTKTQSRLLARFTADLTNDIVSHVLNARYSTFQETPVSQIAGTANSNTVHASLVLNALMQIGNESLLLIFLLFGFFIFQPFLALGALVLSLLTGYFLYVTVIRRSSKLGTAQNHIENIRYRLLFSIAYAIRDIKIMGLDGLFSARNNRVSHDYAELAWRYNLNNALPRLLTELFALLAIVAASLAIVFFASSFDKAGPLLGVAAVAALRVAPALGRIFSAVNTFKFSRPFVNRLIDLRTSLANAAVSRQDDNLSFNHSIELKNVGFRYGDTQILNNVCIELKRGESIGIVGSSGAGKTTLLDLFTGLQQTTEGRFLCDGVIFDPFTSRSMQKFIGYVPQTITLLDDTIAFNVSFEETPDYERVMRVLKIANLENFIASLPDGIETQVGENGIKLSGGQRQRIGIARALYRNPKILVFDEATSSLDTLTEAELTLEIEKLRSQTSVVIVAHRLSTVIACDRIYVLSDGKIESSGTHSELLLTSETYKKLYASQQGMEHDKEIS